ncbi:hypothetical protein [Alkalilimnicola ehrlichii]|uniref:hypothetical protein n=1 Tax=Alkalilimnicola ehrlichii TaxID=351052 RepID=UPI001C6E505E|nr:hypothetical protein [Alkalilimnicola ehrlichii]
MSDDHSQKTTTTRKRNASIMGSVTEELVETLAKLLEKKKYGTSHIDRITTARAYGDISHRLLEITIQRGLNDIEYYRLIGMHYPHHQGSLIDWGKVDWEKYDEGGRPEDVLRNFFQSVR